MRARDIMSSNVVTVTTATSIGDAAVLLTGRGFTALPVLDGSGGLVGLVTEADILLDRFPHDPRFYCSDEGAIRPPDDPPREPATTVGGVMGAPTSVDAGCDVVDLVTAMREQGLRSMPVVDGAALVGIVTRRDLVRTLTRDDAAIAADVLHHLEIYGGPGRWTVDVEGGSVEIADALDKAPDRHAAVVLAEAVRGVTVAHMTHEGAAR